MPRTRLLEPHRVFAVDETCWLGYNQRSNTIQIEVVELANPPQLVREPEKPWIDKSQPFL
jgi:hypothetical protein